MKNKCELILSGWSNSYDSSWAFFIVENDKVLWSGPSNDDSCLSNIPLLRELVRQGCDKYEIEVDLSSNEYRKWAIDRIKYYAGSG